jgi:hypothetical protein
MKLYLQKNEAESAEDAFIKHNLGNRGGNRFLEATDDALISTVIPARVIRANPGIYQVKTVGEARQKIKEKLKKGSDSSKVIPNFEDLFKGE